MQSTETFHVSRFGASKYFFTSREIIKYVLQQKPPDSANFTAFYLFRLNESPEQLNTDLQPLTSMLRLEHFYRFHLFELV